MSVSRLEIEAARAEAAERALRLVPLQGLQAASVTPPRYIVRPYIPRKEVTLLGGHGGAGKSMLALTIAAHVAAGRRWSDLETMPARALYVSLEDPGDVVRYRLRRIAEACGLDAEQVARGLTVVDGTETGGALATERSDGGSRFLLPTRELEEMRELAAGHELIVVDNASDAADFGENDRRMVRGFLRMLARIARENDAGLILLAHIDKHAARNGSQGNSYSGSTAWHNSSRSRLALVTAEGAIELRHEKHQHGPEALPLRMAWSEHGVLIPTGTVSDSDHNDAAAVLAAMRAAHAAGVNVPAARSGPSNAQGLLSTFPELPAHLHGPKGRRDFWAVMGRLTTSGLVEVRQFRAANRHMKNYLVAVGAPVAASVQCARQSPVPPTAIDAQQGAGLRQSASIGTDAELTQTDAAHAADLQRLRDAAEAEGLDPSHVLALDDARPGDLAGLDADALRAYARCLVADQTRRTPTTPRAQLSAPEPAPQPAKAR